MEHMMVTRMAIGEIARGSLAPSNDGAVVLDTLSASPEGRPFWFDTDGERHYETGGMLAVYVPTVQIHDVGQDTDGKRHALVLPKEGGEAPRGVCADSQGRDLAIWSSGTALAGVTCGGCRLSIGLVGTYRKRESNGIPGETWHAIYRVPPELDGLTPITEAEAELYGPPRFERVSAPVAGGAALANERLFMDCDIREGRE
jgi:hypothetical protein